MVGGVAPNVVAYLRPCHVAAVAQISLAKMFWCWFLNIPHFQIFSGYIFQFFAMHAKAGLTSLARAGRAQGRATRAQGGAVRYGDVIDISLLWDLMAMSCSHDGDITGI